MAIHVCCLSISRCNRHIDTVEVGLGKDGKTTYGRHLFNTVHRRATAGSKSNEVQLL
jgi:hypothetical protein